MSLLSGSKGFLIGFTVGFGSGVVLHDYLPKLKNTTQPFFKLAFKSTLLLAEKSREISARLVENLQDLLAEVRFELKEDRALAKGRKKKKRAQGASEGSVEDTNVISLSERAKS